MQLSYNIGLSVHKLRQIQGRATPGLRDDTLPRYTTMLCYCYDTSTLRFLQHDTFATLFPHL